MAGPAAALPATGYSATPLVRKLGIGANATVVVRHAPEGYDSLLAPLPAGVVFATDVSAATDLVHVFVDRRATLERELAGLRPAIRGDAAVWVSWPKQSSRVPTDVTEDVVRACALPLGFVDVKVCAVTAVWSGLKLVIRKALR